ncbi:MAG: fibronectin type III domain-containing protein, partial [Bryobacteraceae bacterium]
ANLAPSTTYYYRIQAYNDAGNSAYSNTSSATTRAVPAAPTSLTATVASATQINLAWSDNSGNETGFRIERSINGGVFSLIASVGANVTTYSNTGLSASTTYAYRVRAYTSMADSPYSNTATATPLAAVAPNGQTLTVAQNGQRTPWDRTLDVSKFVYSRK